MLLYKLSNAEETHACRGEYARNLEDIVEPVLVENYHAETRPGEQDERLVDRNALHLVVELDGFVQKLQLRVSCINRRDAEDDEVENVVHEVAHLEDCVADLKQEDARARHECSGGYEQHEWKFHIVLKLEMT